MKYQSSKTKLIYDLDFTGSKYHVCPECSGSRKKSKQRPLQYYPENNRSHCFHCETTFFEYKPYERKKQYVVPEWKNITKLTDKAVKWFTGRMISQKTLNLMKVYSDTCTMPGFEKEVDAICFPYFLDGKLVNVKFRGPNKTFKLISGAELIMWNIDCLKNSEDCLICEGEIDALSYIEIGFTNVLSVPNGAGSNLDYLNDYIDLFKPLERVYISVDTDSKGIELRDELIRRIGAEKCLTVNTKECKDANEFLVKYGGPGLMDCLRGASPVPIKGVIYAENVYDDIVDLYDNGIQPGLAIGNREIDEYCTWELGRLATVTGEPNSGKSEFVDYIVSRLNIAYGWKVAYFTPENYPIKLHYAKIFEKIIGREFKRRDGDVEFDMAFEHINQNYFYILNEEDLTPDSVLASAKMLVSKEGIKILVIDPYNKLDHQYQSSDTETKYISKFLDKLTNFAKFNNVLLFLIAHPAKLKPGERPNLYSISGSAHFFNKTDYGFTFIRTRDDRNILTNESEVHWQKFRFKNLGKHGISYLKWNYNNGRFEPGKSSVDMWDNSNWLVKGPPAINNSDLNNIGDGAF